jgi:hypothetical protein
VKCYYPTSIMLRDECVGSYCSICEMVCILFYKTKLSDTSTSGIYMLFYIVCHLMCVILIRVVTLEVVTGVFVEVTGYFEIFVTMHKIMHCHKPEDRNLNLNYVLGFTQSLTETSTRNIKIIMFLGNKVQRVCKADNLTAICEPIV